MIRIDPDIIIRKYVMNRVWANKNWLGVICGATGSGKTYFSLAMCERFFPRFNVDYIAFSVKEWLDIFTQCKKGDIIVFDEGQEWNARRSMDDKNVEFANVLSMIRFTQISSIFTLPDIRQIDVTLVRLMHNYLYTMDVDRKTCPMWQRKRSGVYWYEIVKERLPQGGSRDFKTRFPRFDITIRNNRTGTLYEKNVQVKEIWYDAPSEELLTEYERLKRQKFNIIYKKVMGKLKMKDQVEKNKMQMAGVETGEDDTEQHQQTPNPPAVNVPDSTTQNVVNEILNT